MSGLRAVVFDLDGTLVDSAPDIAAALGEALAASELPALGTEAVRGLVGGGARRLIERALAQSGRVPTNEQLESALAAFLAAYRRRPAETSRLYPGVLEILSRLSAAGLVLGVATNKPHDISLAILEALGIRHRFGAIQGSTHGLRLKPEPDLLIAVCRALACEPRDALMVGDSRADVEAARAAGCRVALVAHGYSVEPLEALGADRIMADFADMDSILSAA